MLAFQKKTVAQKNSKPNTSIEDASWAGISLENIEESLPVKRSKKRQEVQDGNLSKKQKAVQLTPGDDVYINIEDVEPVDESIPVNLSQQLNGGSKFKKQKVSQSFESNDDNIKQENFSDSKYLNKDSQNQPGKKQKAIQLNDFADPFEIVDSSDKESPRNIKSVRRIEKKGISHFFIQ